MKALFRIFLLAAVVVAVVFAVFNREVVTIDVWPFPYQVQIPLYLLLLASLLLGFLIGSAVSWSSQGKWRRRARERARRVEAMEREVSALTARLSSASTNRTSSGAEGPPARQVHSGGTG